MEVLKLCEEADKLANVRDYHAAEQCYLKLEIFPQHATPKVCATMLSCSTLAKKIDKTEELFNKAFRIEPQRALTHFNYLALLNQLGRMREGRDITVCTRVRVGSQQPLDTKTCFDQNGSTRAQGSTKLSC